jgi:hypothetical protein
MAYQVSPLQRRLWQLLTAYPPEWREQRGAELVDTVLDLLGPGATRVGPRLAVNLVVGGWLTRLREHPPPRAWLAYRIRGRRLPARWRAWVRRDVTGRFFIVRDLAFRIAFLAAFLGAQGLTFGALDPWIGWGFFIAMFAVGLLLYPLGAVRLRLRILERHGFDEYGRPLPPPAWSAYGPRPAQQVWPWLVAAGGAAYALAVPWQIVLSEWAALDAEQSPVWIAVVDGGCLSCAVLGFVLTGLVAARLPDRLARRSLVNRGRPVPADWRIVAVVVSLYTAASAAAAVARAAWSGFEIDSLLVHVAVLLVAPACLVAGLVARHVERHGGPVVTLRDLAAGAFGVGPMPHHPTQPVVADAAPPPGAGWPRPQPPVLGPPLAGPHWPPA